MVRTAKKRVRTGRRNVRIEFMKQASGTSANTDGQIPETEEEQFERWCSVIPLRGTEQLIADQTQGRVDWRVKVPYDSSTADVTRKWWLTIRDSGVRLNIVHIKNADLANREIEMLCKEKT